MKKTKHEDGISLVELIVSLGILVIISGSGATAIIGSLTATRLAKEHAQASAYAQEGIEAVKSIRNRGWEELVNGSYDVTDDQDFWELTEEQHTFQDKYARIIIIEDAEIEGEIDPEAKKITSRVTWNHGPVRISQVEYFTYLTNWQTVRAHVPGGPSVGTCNDYCLTLGRSSGFCAPVPGHCDYYVAFADQFCTGGPSRDTCCCDE